MSDMYVYLTSGAILARQFLGQCIWRVLFGFVVLVATTLAYAQPSAKAVDASPHKSSFFVAGGVRLHYLDWGGTGEAVIFLPGAGDTAHVYDQMAPKFTDKFRVLGLTRRGFGESDKPEKGYDVDTLTNDVLELVDHLKLKKVHLIGHSLAGNEMFHFAIKHPKRTLKLVFLDAGYGDRKSFYDTEPRPPAPERKPSELTLEDKIDEEYAKYGDPYDPDFRRVRSPSLSFYVMVEKHWAARPGMDEGLRKRVEDWIDSDVRPYQTRNIERFRKEVKNSEVIVLPNTTHYFFRDPKMADVVVATVRRFLSEGLRGTKTPAAGSHPEQKIVDQLFAAWNSHDANKVAVCFSADAVYEDAAAGKTHRGQAEIREWAAGAFRDIENFKIEVLSTLVTNGQGFAEWRWSGTDIGLMKTGKSFSVRGVSIFEIRNGKIQQYKEYYDFATVLRQLGLMPTNEQ